MRRGAPPLPLALAGALVALLYLLMDVAASGSGILRPIQAGRQGPAAAVVARDFPEASIPEGVGLDGQQFYAIARDPMHPEAVAPSLDNPRYRYQRPLYPVLAWLLHPSGGGPGLVWALVAVNLLGLVAGGVALGELSRSLRGPPWLAFAYPLLPGSLWALTGSVADALAVSLALVTVVATVRGHSRLAWCAAVAAVLTRETTILVPLALVLARRRKEDLPLLLLPAAALVAWLTIVRLAVPAGGLPSEGLVFPLTGLVDAVRVRWLHGQELVGMAATVAALIAGTVVLARRRGPVELRWIVAVQLAFLTLCSGDVLGNDFGGTRSTLLLLAVSLAALVSRAAGPAEAYLPSTSARNLPV